MTSRRSLAIVLAAGEGTRMKSDRPKVLHEIAHRPMVGHVVATARGAGIDAIALVAGRGADKVAEALDGLVAPANVFIQAQRLGTAHAVLAARAALADRPGEVIVMFGDTPLVTSAEIADLRGAIAAGADVAVMGFEAADPAGYGRLIVKDGRLAAIREDKDCSPAERGITLCNAGLMALSGARALELLDAVGNDNAKGEYYLTDVVEIAAGRGLDTRYTLADAQSVVGVNDRVQLAEAEAIWQARRRAELMRAGVTMTAPETVHLSHDTEIGADTVIEPNVVIGPGVSIAPKAVIRAFSHLEGCTIESGAEIGPFARLRPGARLGEKAKVGNFCEVKNAEVEAGAKVNHLSYIGDARVGRAANIGAGTITCNYDGFLKHRTEIGAGAFIGSNTSLVAPITIGEEAYVASGSVVTVDVPKDALAFGRARQENKAGLGARLRERLKAAKERRKAAASAASGD